MEQCKRLNIRVLTEHRVKDVLMENGRVTGVLAEDPGGELLVECDACVLAMGGFAGNRELLKKYGEKYFDGNPVHLFSCPTLQGDCIEIAEKIGAKVDYDQVFLRIFGPAHHPFLAYSLYRIIQQPETVYINLDGKRWIDESAGLMNGLNMLTKQPGGVMYGLVDDKLLDFLAQRLIENPPDGNDDWILRDYRVEIEKSVAGGFSVKRADTIEKLAEQIGADPVIMKAEIDRYNEFCRNGRDVDFVKHPSLLMPIENPPFYAIYGQRCCEGADLGVEITDDLEVVSKCSEVMDGLFAVGDDASGYRGNGRHYGIGALTWAVSSGYQAGPVVANYLRGSTLENK
jgi:fumarate reductase flavoprotein subunit